MSTSASTRPLSPRSRRSRRGAALALLLASLLALCLGRFVQLDDTSGFGSDEWVLPLGLVAGLLALASVAAALPDRAARRAVGLGLAALDVVVVVLSIAVDGFRFVWLADEAELVYLVLALALAALFLLTPAFRSAAATRPDGAAQPGGGLTGWARASIYAAATTAGALMAFSAGHARFVATECTGAEGECDLAVLAGLFWAAGAVVLGAAVVVVVELSRSRRRRAGRGRRATLRT